MALNNQQNLAGEDLIDVKSRSKTQILSGFSSGTAGSRTRVQTRKPYAFYMFSPDLFFM